jgi:hypothetical protein
MKAVCVPVKSAWKCNEHLSIINMDKYDTRIEQLDSFRDFKRIKVIFTGSHFLFIK